MILHSLRANQLASSNSFDESARLCLKHCSLGLTRREFLKVGGMAAAAMTIAVPLGGAAEVVSPVLGKLSEYMSRAGDQALPAEAMDATKQHILDTIAAMVSGAALPPGRVGLH